MSKSKDVFFLGAGFSKGVGAPLQAEILYKILNLNTANIQYEKRPIFVENVDRIRKLLTEIMYLDITDKELLIDLEDVFTPLDACISNNYSFRNLSINDVIEYRKSLDVILSMFMEYELEYLDIRSSYIQKIADYVVEQKVVRPKSDKVSFITTNWDIILDNAIYRSINKQNLKNGVIDYCCHTTQYDTEDKIMPSLLAKGKGYYNVKILKLHGSLNWLFCPRCNRLYTKFYKKISTHEFIKRPVCRICDKNFRNTNSNDQGPMLTGQLLMPTYMKDLSNVQFKMIWQKANIELSEAKKIIFIGYSFPMADFEIRQLLSRNVPHDTEIEVVLKGNNKEIERRYRSFFGRRNINFNIEGAEKYIEEYIESN